MDENFTKLLSLIIGIAYMVFSHSRNRPAEEPMEDAMPDEDLLPPEAPASDWIEAWEEVPEASPISTPYPSTTVATPSPAPARAKPPSMPPAATPPPPQRAVARVLSRYKGWKKAVVMSEIIRPHA